VENHGIKKRNSLDKIENQPPRTSAQVPPGSAKENPAAKKKQKTRSEEASSTATAMKQCKEAAPISAKQNAVDGHQKQVQQNFSMDHKLFKKFWQLVSCHKYHHGRGFGQEV
jgi:hypothetical protein